MLITTKTIVDLDTNANALAGVVIDSVYSGANVFSDIWKIIGNLRSSLADLRKEVEAVENSNPSLLPLYQEDLDDVIKRLTRATNMMLIGGSRSFDSLKLERQCMLDIIFGYSALNDYIFMAISWF